MSKIDISDGFYHVRLALDDALLLAILLPSIPGKPPLVTILFLLPMGWVESPRTSALVTETTADVANQHMHRAERSPSSSRRGCCSCR